MRIFTLVTISLCLMGCGRAVDVQAPRTPVTTPALKSFPPEDATLAVNAMFLWKEGVTAADINRISALGDDFGKLKSHLGALMAQKAPEANIRAVMQQLGNVTAKLKAETDEFTSPDFVKVRFIDGNPKVLIAGKPEVDATYTVEGGILKFTLGSYEICMARNRYEMVAAGIVSFYGDIKVTTATGAKRFGVFKGLGRR